MFVSMRGLLLLKLLALVVSSAAEEPTSYANVTLSSLDGNLQVTVYLPSGLEENEGLPAYYESSRFDHGSMIGSIRQVVNDKGDTREFFGTKLWRTPHNAYWPESGVGLAAEFGVGDNGGNCDYRCGWYGINDVTNGVLGYKEALPGDPFLKIGVGALIKGTCPECDSSGDYKFNSPYVYASPPEWKLLSLTDQKIELQHEAQLENKHRFGYRLKKAISIDETSGNTLSVTSTLTNLGQAPFTTAWYSHNFFSCNERPIGPGYSLEMDIHETTPPLYEEPGLLFSWSTPLRNFAKVFSRNRDNVLVQLMNPVTDGTRIKAEFSKDNSSQGSFVLEGCNSRIAVDFPDLQESLKGQPPNNGVSMYAYNLYIERAILSPEPQLLIHLEPGATTSWTQRLEITSEEVGEEEGILDLEGMSTSSLVMQRAGSTGIAAAASVMGTTRRLGPMMVVMVVVVGAALYVGVLASSTSVGSAGRVSWCSMMNRGRNPQRILYTPIPDQAPRQDDCNEA